MGGRFDGPCAGPRGYAEEILDFASHFPTRPFDIIAFDGPGQGHTALAGMPLEPEWERPTDAVLDYFGVDSAAALGVSFGGYLVMRAAAYCPRISHVIAFDMMYRLLDGLTLPLPRPLRPIADAVVGKPRPAWLVDAALRIAPRFSADLAWKLQQASHLTGLKRPSEVLRAFGDYTMEPLEGRITQPCLILAGDADQYVPFERLRDVRRALRNARYTRSITRRILTWRSTVRSGTWIVPSRSWAAGSAERDPAPAQNCLHDGGRTIVFDGGRNEIAVDANLLGGAAHSNPEGRPLDHGDVVRTIANGDRSFNGKREIPSEFIKPAGFRHPE